jgi:hypothetical protein
MKISTQIKAYVVVITLSLLGLIVVHLSKLNELENLNQELLKCQTDQNYIPGGDITFSKETDSVLSIVDSLRDELFIERVDAGRHELTRGDILNKYPKVKKEYEKYYNHQTE